MYMCIYICSMGNSKNDGKVSMHHITCNLHSCTITAHVHCACAVMCMYKYMYVIWSVYENVYMYMYTMYM